MFIFFISNWVSKLSMLFGWFPNNFLRTIEIRVLRMKVVCKANLSMYLNKSPVLFISIRKIQEKLIHFCYLILINILLVFKSFWVNYFQFWWWINSVLGTTTSKLQSKKFQDVNKCYAIYLLVNILHIITNNSYWFSFNTLPTPVKCFV